MRGMEIPNRVSGVPQVGNGLPGSIRVRPTFPVHQVLQMLAFVARVHDMLNFVFLFAILRDGGGARGSHRLTRKAFAIWLYVRDVDDGVNAHRVGKTELNGIGPDQLRDGIGAEPSF